MRLGTIAVERLASAAASETVSKMIQHEHLSSLACIQETLVPPVLAESTGPITKLGCK